MGAGGRERQEEVLPEERGRGAWSEHVAVCLAPALLVTCTMVGAHTWALLSLPLGRECQGLVSEDAGREKHYLGAILLLLL